MFGCNLHLDSQHYTYFHAIAHPNSNVDTEQHANCDSDLYINIHAQHDAYSHAVLYFYLHAKQNTNQNSFEHTDAHTQ